MHVGLKPTKDTNWSLTFCIGSEQFQTSVYIRGKTHYLECWVMLLHLWGHHSLHLLTIESANLFGLQIMWTGWVIFILRSKYLHFVSDAPCSNLGYTGNQKWCICDQQMRSTKSTMLDPSITGHWLGWSDSFNVSSLHRQLGHQLFAAVVHKCYVVLVMFQLHVSS